MSAAVIVDDETDKTYRGITIRNLWLLMLYASDLFAEVEHKRKQQGREEIPDDLPDIIAEILVYFVKERLMRGLTRSSVPQKADLTRVRGSIDMLRTERHQLLDRGLVACRFHEPTLNTPRNRLIRAALQKGALRVTKHSLAQTCRDYATLMYRMGVTDGLPTRHELSKEVLNLNSKEDRHAIDAAKLLLDMMMPSNLVGNDNFLDPEARSKWLQKLFERAIRGFYCVVADDWTVTKTNTRQEWPIRDDTEMPSMRNYFPKMELDIVLINREQQKKIVIDTKFTSLLKAGWYRDETLSSAYIYQMYAYLRSQEEKGEPEECAMNKCATGILLHPVTSGSHKLSFFMQGHNFIFATVNLNATAKEIRKALLDVIDIE